MVTSNIPRRLPKIVIDYTKCRIPFACKKCLQICPQMIFSVKCEKEERLKETDPRIPDMYKLRAIRPDRCTICNECIEVCTEGAIEIVYP